MRQGGGRCRRRGGVLNLPARPRSGRCRGACATPPPRAALRRPVIVPAAQTPPPHRPLRRHSWYPGSTRPLLDSRLTRSPLLLGVPQERSIRLHNWRDASSPLLDSNTGTEPSAEMEDAALYGALAVAWLPSLGERQAYPFSPTGLLSVLLARDLWAIVEHQRTI